MNVSGLVAVIPIGHSDVSLSLCIGVDLREFGNENRVNWKNEGILY